MWCCAVSAATSGASHSPDCEKLSVSLCPNHKIIAHDQAGLERWCDFCGLDADGARVRRGAGGWATPSRISR
jgi:hypothetical protein